MKSGYDEELTTSAENAFHTGIALYLYIKRVFVSVNLRGWESDLKVVTGPCKAIRRHGDEVIGKEDVDLTSMYFIKHAETAYPGP